MIYIKLRSCYSSYDLNSQISIASHDELIKDSEKDSLHRSWLCCQLREWWAEKTLRMFLTDYMNHCSSLIMLDSILESLTNWAEYIHDKSSLRCWVEDEWSNLQIYHLEIIIILKQSHSMSSDVSEIFNEWRWVNDIKRNRISDLNANDALMNFNNQRDSWFISCEYDKLIEDAADTVNDSWKRVKIKKSSTKSVKLKEKIQSSMLNESHDKASQSISSEQTSMKSKRKLETDASNSTDTRQSHEMLREIEINSTTNNSRELSLSEMTERKRKLLTRYES